MDITLVDNSAEGRQQKNYTGTPRLAIVSNSMLLISENIIKLSPWTSAILISSTTIEESSTSSSVVVKKCKLLNDVGEMRGVVETPAFPSFGGSASVSIIGCSFDSTTILGTDGIVLSLTRAVRKNVEDIGRISSSLIGCSFVNMSSIGSSCQPHLPHLSQTMLGCVVSLTSSHLSGSTIRDVNTVGCVLCSNSSFSSLLPSPNTDTDSTQGTVTLPGKSIPEPFEDRTVYSFDKDSGVQTTSITFSHCPFSGSKYPSARPLTFNNYPGTIFVLSCSFDGMASCSEEAGAIFLLAPGLINPFCFTANSSNFTSCSACRFAGAIYVSVVDGVLINSCRFEHCTTTGELSTGGALVFDYFIGNGPVLAKRFQLSDCVLADCRASTSGGGVHVNGELELSVVDTKFERCEVSTESELALGGGISVGWGAALIVMGSHFIDCMSRHAGGAIGDDSQGTLTISDSLVKDCVSKGTGAICIIPSDDSGVFSFSRVFFDGNKVGEDTAFFRMFMSYAGNSSKFPDVAIMCTSINVLPTITFQDCFTTIIPDSSGMIKRGSYNQSAYAYDPVRHFDVEFAKIGPLLTAAPTARLNEKTGKIELEMKGKTSPISQEYEVTVKENGNETEFKLRMLFLGGTGTLVSGSEVNLKFNTDYTISKMAGVVPASSSSTQSNAFEVPAAAWAFNITLTPTFLTFTTPKSPPSIVSVTCVLLSDDPKFARVIVVLNEKLKGSLDIVVLEEGKEVTLSFSIDSCSKSGATKEFKVIGKGKVLTHDTTYTIQSIVPTPGTDALFVWMNDTITFRIPKSSYDPKKSMSPEAKALLSWLVPLVACLLIALLVTIVVIVLLRRRQQKNALPAQKEMDAQEPLDVEKVDENDIIYSNGVIRTDENDQSAFHSFDNHPTRLNPSSDGMNSLSKKEGELVEVMACSGDFGISTAPMTNTLYSVLHKEHREIGKRGVWIQIVNGLKQVVATRGWSDVLTRLSSHWILIDTAGNVQLKLQMTESSEKDCGVAWLCRSEECPE